jgi:pyruvate carboxylase subunit B
MKTLKIRDLTLRDGQQSAFATRMTQAQIDRVLPFYKDAGFYAMEVWGGAVPDSVMRFLGENPWDRLEKIYAAVGDVSKLTALSRGRNLFGYQPYPDNIIEGFCKNSISSGLGIMRIFDALNDVDNVASTIKYVKQYGGIADCAVCYTIDPKYPKLSFWDKIRGKRTPAPVFTDEYFLGKVKQMVALGADMITIKDMSGLIPPRRVYDMVSLFKQNISVPVDFHTHCTPGYGLASVISAIAAGADVVDTAIWNFAGGPAAPAFELVWLFCKKMGIAIDVNMDAVAKINEGLISIRAELCDFDAVKSTLKPFDPVHDTLPAEIDALFDRAVAAATAVDEDALVDACHKIEAWFGFPAPNELVKNAEIPGGMYTNMVAQLKQLKNEDILPRAMELIPSVRLDSGLPPLVTPTSQIVGAQAVNCAMDEKSGKPRYTTKSVQFVNLVKGEYGHTPVAVDPAFREKITGSPVETNYDTSKHRMQPNPTLDECGGVLLAADEKEVLLLELFPQVAKDFLTRTKSARYTAEVARVAAEKAAEAAAVAEETARRAAEAAAKIEAITGRTVNAPLPGRILEFLVKPGDAVTANSDMFVLEAMKMENTITAETTGTVKRLLVNIGDNVAADQPVVELE